MAYGDWKESSRYWVHSLYKGHLPITDTSRRSRGVRTSEVPLYYNIRPFAFLLLYVYMYLTYGTIACLKFQDICTHSTIERYGSGLLYASVYHLATKMHYNTIE